MGIFGVNYHKTSPGGTSLGHAQEARLQREADARENRKNMMQAARDKIAADKKKAEERKAKAARREAKAREKKKR